MKSPLINFAININIGTNKVSQTFSSTNESCAENTEVSTSRIKSKSVEPDNSPATIGRSSGSTPSAISQFCGMMGAVSEGVSIGTNTTIAILHLAKFAVTKDPKELCLGLTSGAGAAVKLLTVLGVPSDNHHLQNATKIAEILGIVTVTPL